MCLSWCQNLHQIAEKFLPWFGTEWRFQDNRKSIKRKTDSKNVKSLVKTTVFYAVNFFQSLGHYLLNIISSDSFIDIWNLTETKIWQKEEAALCKIRLHQNHTKNFHWPNQTSISTCCCSFFKKIVIEKRRCFNVWT